MSYRHHLVVFSLLLVMLLSCSTSVVISKSFTEITFSTDSTTASLTTSGYSINNVLKIISYPKNLHIPPSNSNLTIAVIDSGINDSVISNFWTNSKEIPNNSIDDDHNGYVDDYYGFDFVTNKPVDFQSSSFSSHGTFIANILSQMTKNVSTINIMDIRVLNSENENSNFNSFVNALQYALLFPSVKVIQFSIEFVNSFLSSYPKILHWIFTKAYLRHIAIVTVTGNDERQQISDPGNWAETIAVTSVDLIDNKWIKSIYANNGSNIDVSVPGTDIQSLGSNGKTIEMSGTSFSAAFVGGAIALLDAEFPSRNMSIETIRNLLQSSAIQLNNCNQFGAGLLNVSNLLSLANSSSYLDYKAICPSTYIVPTTLGPEPISKNLDFSNFFISGLFVLLIFRKCKIRKLKRTLSFRNIIN